MSRKEKRKEREEGTEKEGRKKKRVGGREEGRKEGRRKRRKDRQWNGIDNQGKKLKTKPRKHHHMNGGVKWKVKWAQA